MIVAFGLVLLVLLLSLYHDATPTIDKYRAPKRSKVTVRKGGKVKSRRIR